MELSQGCVNVQLLLQRILYPSIQIVAVNDTIKFQVHVWKKNAIARRCHTVGKLLAIALLIATAIRVLVLFRFWKEGNNAEQLCFNTLVFAMCHLPLGAYSILEHNFSAYCFAMTECLNLVKFRRLGFPSTRRHLSLSESAVYMFSAGMLAMPVLYQINVFAIDHHPLKLAAKRLNLLTNIWTNILVALLSSVIYDFASVHGSGSFYFVLLGMVSFIEGMHIASSRLLRRGGMRIFKNQLRLYRVIYILLQIGGGVAGHFAERLIAMGILTASCGGYVFIKLCDDLPIFIYTIISLCFPLFISCMFLMVTLAATPESNAAKFKQLWKRELMNHSDRIRLLACPPLGYCCAFIHNCNRRTALSIANVTVNLVATLTLLKM